MNLLDLAIVGVIGISLLFGLYSGFLSSLLNSLGLLLSLFFSSIFYSSLATWFKGHQDWVGQLVHYTEGAARIPTLELARSSISSLSPEQITQTIDQANFPAPFGHHLLLNIANNALASTGSNTLADYFNQTVVMVSINLLSFVMLFALLYIGFSVAIAATGYVLKLPVLRKADSLAGGAVGLGRGILLALVCCALLPIILAALPAGIPMIDDFMQKSSLLQFFLHSNPILDTIRGTL